MTALPSQTVKAVSTMSLSVAAVGALLMVLVDPLKETVTKESTMKMVPMP